jgi:SAM-dependent methyltransferase
MSEPSASEPPEPILQANQPEGVPPLPLTGERTLPDVPEENYWYRRHLVVYEWIAKRCRDKSVVDLACGEGYGSDLLAQEAASVVGVDANPEAHEHAQLRYRRPNLEFRRELVEAYDEPCDVVVFCQTIEHIHEPEKLLDRIAGIAPVAYITTPNRLTLAPEGAEKSDNPWHIREYDADEYRELLERSFDRVKVLGLFHSGKLRLHEHALKLGWDRVHKGLGVTERFYDRFTPSIKSSDFALRPGNLDRALDFVAVCSSDRSRST